MRIDGSNPWSGVEGLVTQKSDVGKTGDAKPDPSSFLSGDEAKLSREGTLANRLYRQVGELPEIRRDKVDQLRQSLSQGTYNVSSDQVADAMLNDFHSLTLCK